MYNSNHEYITGQHIEKLEHKIAEIRERALLNICAKIDRGILFDNDTARCKQLIDLLVFKWFTIEQNKSIQNAPVVFKLIKKIIKSQAGNALIVLKGPHELIAGFENIRVHINHKYHSEIDDIQEYLRRFLKNVVPPLDLSEVNTDSFSESDSKSTNSKSIEGVINSLSSLEVDNGNIPSANTNIQSSSCSRQQSNPFKYFVFQWQWLISADRHVLESVEETLRNPKEPSALLNSCDFIVDVLLYDFPAEVFLQRPTIIKLLHDLLWSTPSSRIATAVLKCLARLSMEFMNRIQFYDDPKSHNLKLNNYCIGTIIQEENCSLLNESLDCEIEVIDETKQLMNAQMSIPQYCLNTINAVFDYLYIAPDSGDSFRRKKCLIGLSIALSLLKACIELFKSSVNACLFQIENQQHQRATLILKKFTNTFEKYGEILTHFRIKVLSEDFHEESRLVHLHLIANFVNLCDYIPSSYVAKYLPENLKHAVSNSIVDPSLNRLYPILHARLFDIALLSGGDTEALQLYRNVTVITKSMSAAIQFLQDSKSLPFTKNVYLVSEALPCLEFLKNTTLVSSFIDLCANKLTMHSFDADIFIKVEDICLKLLSHAENDIRLEAYKSCQRKILKTVGAKLNTSKSSLPGSQILFLLRPKILCAIAAHGTQDRLNEIRSFSEDIIVHIIKCKILVSEEIWEEAISSLIPVMPILITQIGVQKSLIGRNLLAILDPDRCRQLNLGASDVLRLNAACLFVKNNEIRLEAVSRLCWLLNLSKETSDAREKVRLLPHLNNLHDKALSMVCLIDRPADFKTLRLNQTHFYQTSSLKQIIDLLASNNVEPVIRRSAVTQMSVMLEDPVLHSIFLENNGLVIIKDVMYSALIENDYQNYPDSIVPCLNALKHLCVYNPTVRQEISQSEEYISYILRGIFLFCTEERIKQDGAILLFLIVFANFIKGSPVRNEFSILQILQQYLNCPFLTKTHWNTDEYSMKQFKDLLHNKWALSSLQIHWNLEWFSDIDDILKSTSLEYDNGIFSKALKMNHSDLLALKNSSIGYLLKTKLEDIYNSQSREILTKNIYIIIVCLKLHAYVKDSNLTDNISTFEWEKSLSRVINSPPAGQEDNIILTHVIRLLSYILPHLEYNNNFITALLSNNSHYFATLLSQEFTDALEEDEEKLLNALLHLVKTVTNASPIYTHKKVILKEMSYIHLGKIIVNNLQSNGAQEGGHFYNLAYLDKLLSCLVNLTGTYGWSGSKANEKPKVIFEKLSEISFELLSSFHSGKGSGAPHTLMGLSITRNIILILNHFLAEVQHFHIKNWEEYFVSSDINRNSILLNIFNLRLSRDVTLRTASLHLLCGLAMSPKLAATMIKDIATRTQTSFWKICINIICDLEEASIVRETAALLLANISSHVMVCPDTKNALLMGLLNTKFAKTTNTLEIQQKTLTSILDGCNFFTVVSIILKNIYTSNVFRLREFREAHYNEICDDDDFMFIYHKTLRNDMSITFSDSLNLQKQRDSTFESKFSLTCAGEVRTLAMFIHNLVNIMPQYMTIKLHEEGIIKLLFKCVTLPNIQIEDTSDVIFCTDLLQMNSAVCAILGQSASLNRNCLLTIANARDCLNTVTTLFDSALYLTSIPEILYLRNKLWTNIFRLLEVLLTPIEGGDKLIEQGGYNRTTLILQFQERKHIFLQSLCESISSELSNDLQISALNSLTNLIRCSDVSIDSSNEEDGKLSARSSIQTLFDSTKTAKSNYSNSAYINKESALDILQDVYFGDTYKQQFIPQPVNTEDEWLAGAELCKLLVELYEVLALHPNNNFRKKQMVLNSLSGLLGISNAAKDYALHNAFLIKILDQVKQIYVQLSLETVECLRKASDRKRVTVFLDDLEAQLGLIMNFMNGYEKAKDHVAKLGLADIIHKLWHWFMAQRNLLLLALKLLCTMTYKSPVAISSLILTSSTIGATHRKTPNNTSLLHQVCTTIEKEMEMLSRTHTLEPLELSFRILLNAMAVSECRFIIIKSHFLQTFLKLHPALTKRQKSWESVEFYWLQFLEEFTAYPEGQIEITKSNDIFHIILLLCGSPNEKNRFQALSILRNVAFHQGNRSRLIGSDDVINILNTRFGTLIISEIELLVSILRFLSANCQKAKMIFKCAGLDQRIMEFLRMAHIGHLQNVPEKLISDADYVLSLIQDGEQTTSPRYS